MKKLLFVIVSSLLFITSYAGGPWVYQKGKGFVQAQVGFTPYSYGSLLNGGARDTEGINRYIFDSDYQLYSEYGISNKFDVMVNLPLKYVSAGKQTDSLYFPTLLESGSLFGLGNIKIGGKMSVYDKKMKGAISLQTALRTSTRDLNKGLSTGYDANVIGIYGHYGGSVSNKTYFFIESGYRYFSNDFSDMIDFKIEIGNQLAKKLLFIFYVDGMLSTKNGNNFDEKRLQTGLYANNQEAIVGKIKLLYDLNETTGFSFGMPLIPGIIRNYGFAGNIALGVYKKI